MSAGRLWLSRLIRRRKEDSLDAQSEGNRDFIDKLGFYYPGYAGVFTGEIRIVGTRSIASLQEACALHPEYQRLVDAIISPGANDQPRALICSERDRLGRTSSLVSQLEFFCLEYNMVPVARYSYFLESAHFGVVARFLPPSAKIRVHAIIYGRTQAAGSLPGKDRT